MSTRIFLAQLRERSGGLLYEYQQAMVYRWFSAARLAHWRESLQVVHLILKLHVVKV